MTDDAIKEGLLTNPAYSGGNPPSIISPVDYFVKYNEDQWVFTPIFFEFTQGTVNVEVDQNFEIYFVFPGGVYIQGNIIKYEYISMTIKFVIEREINVLPLILEQIVIFLTDKNLLF